MKTHSVTAGVSRMDCFTNLLLIKGNRRNALILLAICDKELSEYKCSIDILRLLFTAFSINHPVSS